LRHVVLASLSFSNLLVRLGGATQSQEDFVDPGTMRVNCPSTIAQLLHGNLEQCFQLNVSVLGRVNGFRVVWLQVQRHDVLEWCWYQFGEFQWRSFL